MQRREREVIIALDRAIYSARPHPESARQRPSHPPPVACERRANGLMISEVGSDQRRLHTCTIDETVSPMKCGLHLTPMHLQSHRSVGDLRRSCMGMGLHGHGLRWPTCISMISPVWHHRPHSRTLSMLVKTTHDVTSPSSLMSTRHVPSEARSRQRRKDGDEIVQVGEARAWIDEHT